MNKINLEEKFALFHDHWHPRIVGELNGQHVKIALLGHVSTSILLTARKG